MNDRRTIVTALLGAGLAVLLLAPIHVIGSRPDPAVVSLLGMQRAETLLAPGSGTLEAIYGGGTSSLNNTIEDTYVALPNNEWMLWTELRDRSLGSTMLLNHDYDVLPATLTFSERVQLSGDEVESLSRHLYQAMLKPAPPVGLRCLAGWEYSHVITLMRDDAAFQIFVPRKECGRVLVSGERFMRYVHAPGFCELAVPLCVDQAPLPDWVGG